MPLNISETARARDHVGRPAQRWLLRSSLTCCVAAAALAGSGCQLILDDIEHADGAIVGLDGATDAAVLPARDAESEGDGGGTPIDAAPMGQADVDTVTDAPVEASPNDATPDTARDTGSPDPDPNACDGAGERTFYADEDGDGYGNPNMPWVGCEARERYVERTGDCHDGNGEVHEGQTKFFGVGYARPDLSIPSFDYNCDDDESFGPEQRLQPCSAGLLACSGGGYGVNNQRAGFPGINPYCGSRDFLVCEGLPLLSGCDGMPTMASTAFTCR